MIESTESRGPGTRRPLVGWVIYDMPAHAYALMISGVGFPVYFASFVVAGRGNSDVLWSIALGLPLLLAGILGPLLGALADASGGRRSLLIAATVACSVATALLVLVGKGDIMLGIGLFAVAHFTHLIAVSIYNSYLSLVTTPSRFARVSGVAWGLSYFGSLACLLLCLPFTRGGLVPENVTNFTWIFPVTAIFLTLIGVPAALALPKDRFAPARNATTEPRRRIRSTIQTWRRDRSVPTFLLAYYLVNDGVVTVVFFTALTFRITYGLDVQEILGLSLLLQLVAIPMTMLFGLLGERWSQRGALYVALVLWMGVLSLMASAEGLQGAVAVTLALGVVLGSTQSLFRSLFAGFVPVERTSEYFGFHTLVGRASAVLGPLAFGAVSVATGSQRAAMASLAVFFILGGVVLAFVRLPAPVDDVRASSNVG